MIIRALLLQLCFLGTLHAADLQVGAAAVKIDPLPGTPVAGYYSPRGAKDVLDSLYAKALVIEYDTTKVAIVTCDLISLPRGIVEKARKAIELRTGIPGANVMIHATHTHTGPAVPRESSRDQLDGGANELAQRYALELPEKLAESVALAMKRMDSAFVFEGISQEDRLSFNRRFNMKDGSVSWNPAKRNPNIIKPAGPIDPAVNVIYFEGLKNKPLATFVNFALHPDTVGGELISADYPGQLARLMSDYKGDGMVTLFANGCCGNINHRNIEWLDGQKGPTESKRIGTLLAAATLKAFPTLKSVDPAQGGLRSRSKMVALPLAKITPDEITKAKEVIAGMKSGGKSTFMEQVKAYQVMDVIGRDGKPWEVEVQVITLGDRLAWVSLPGEIFVELGLAIKKDSPFANTSMVELANGSIGYIPNKSAYPEGNYEVISARCAEGSGEILVETALNLLKK
jgi:neutral ceramidase